MWYLDPIIQDLKTQSSEIYKPVLADNVLEIHQISNFWDNSFASYKAANTAENLVTRNLRARPILHRGFFAVLQRMIVKLQIILQNTSSPDSSRRRGTDSYHWKYISRVDDAVAEGLWVGAQPRPHVSQWLTLCVV